MSAAEVTRVPDSVVEQIAGADLVRLRSRTVFYVLRRMKEAAAAWLRALPPEP